MPEIGYWKYIKFNDDEKQYFGTDDDIAIVFDSADDRLEYRMKKDIRFEDDTGVRILTIQKATRTLSGFKMTGNVEIEKAYPAVILNATEGNALLRFLTNGVLDAFFGYDTTNDRVTVWDSASIIRFQIDPATGDIPKVGNIDMGGNLMKNMKLGTDLKTNGYHIYHGVANTGRLVLGGGSVPTADGGGVVSLFGIGFVGEEGRVDIAAGKVNNVNARVNLYTPDTVTALLKRIVINQGDDPDIDILNAKLDFHDQDLIATAGVEAGHIIIRVKGTDYKLKVYHAS